MRLAWRDGAAAGRQRTWSSMGAFARAIVQTATGSSGDAGTGVQAGEAAWSWCACAHRPLLYGHCGSARLDQTANLLEKRRKFQSRPDDAASLTLQGVSQFNRKHSNMPIGIPVTTALRHEMNVTNPSLHHQLLCNYKARRLAVFKAVHTEEIQHM